MSGSEFAAHMLRLAQDASPFEPSATYDPDGDCIEFIAKPDSFYAERIDNLVTVYYSHATNEVVGSLIKSVSRFRQDVVDKVPGFAIEINDGRVRLVHIFRARLWTSHLTSQDIVTLTYRKLIKVAEETQVETDFAVA
jgi:effector-binding domain-containing protein